MRKSVRRSKSLEDPEQIFISLHKNSSNCKVNLAYITENLPKQEEFALLVKDHIDVDKTLFKVTVKSREEYEFDEEHEIPFYHSIEDYKADPMLFKVFANVFLVEILVNGLFKLLLRINLTIFNHHFIELQKQISEKRVDDFKDSITQSVQLLLEEFPKVQFTCRCEGDEKPVFFSNAQDISTTVKSAAELADAMNGINVLRQGTKFALNHSTFARNTFFKNILRVTEPNYDLSNIKQTKK